MRKERTVNRFAAHPALVLALAVAAAGMIYAQQVATNVGYGAKKADGGRAVPLETDQKLNMAMKIKQPFTIVAVGDLLEFQPFARSIDPDIQYVVNITRNADVTIADLENELRDFDNFGHIGGNLATKEVADDFAYMGIDLVSRANNKQTDYASVWEDFQQVERVGIIHAGVARTMGEARMPRYFGTPKGLVGFVGLTSDGGTEACCPGGQIVDVTAEQLAQVRAIKESILARRDEVEVPVALPAPDADGTVNVFGVTFRQGPKATTGIEPAVTGRGGRGAGGGAAGGRGGPGNFVKNTVRLTLFHGVTAEQMKQLRAIAGDTGTGSDLHAFGTQFRLMDRPGEHSFDMDPQDLKDMLTQIRSGKQGSDFVATNFHWHQNRYDFQAYSHDHFPADYEIKFAHMAIDQGDDLFAAQGVHTIKGMEIYKGKPVFYGLSNFVFQAGIMARAKGTLLFAPPGAPTDAAAATPTGFGTAAAGGRRGGGGAAEEADAAVTGARGGGRGGRGAAPASGDEIVGEYQFGGSWQLLANMEALMAESRYENGQLAEVRVYPLDLGQTPRPMSQLGIPRRPTPAVAKKILDEFIEYSKPFHTKIVVENGVAVIRIPPAERQ